jgi:twitching motility protein PilT
MDDSLSDIDFVDLYVHVNGDSPSRMRAFRKGRELPPIMVVPARFDGFISGLRQAISERPPSDFSLAFDGVRYRVSSYITSAKEHWASLRKIPTTVPHMSNLGIPTPIQRRLTFFAKNSGLILLCGATGQGKSTTAVSLIGHYLEKFGDVCIAIEDPVEYDLQGQDWGPNGSCFQFEVTEEREWAEYLKMALRWHPRYIYLGELRTPEACAQALRAATSGHLVVTTIHAGTIQDALHAIRQLVLPIAGERADQLIADSFLSCVHQKLTPSGPDMKILFAEGKGLGDPVRAQLRDGRIEQLQTHIEAQNRTKPLV